MGKEKTNNKVLGWTLVVSTIMLALVLSLGGLFFALVGVLHAISANLGSALFFFGLFLIALGILSFGLFNAKKIYQDLKARVAKKEGE